MQTDEVYIDCITHSSHYQNVGDHALLIFARNCPHIESLSLGGCGKLTDHTCHSLARHAAKLTRCMAVVYMLVMM